MLKPISWLKPKSPPPSSTVHGKKESDLTNDVFEARPKPKFAQELCAPYGKKKKHTVDHKELNARDLEFLNLGSNDPEVQLGTYDPYIGEIFLCALSCLRPC